MLCPRCQQQPDAHHDNRKSIPLGREDPEDRVVCDRCGGAVASGDAAGPLLAKLAQLARFGLVADGGPLLEPIEKSD